MPARFVELEQHLRATIAVLRTNLPVSMGTRSAVPFQNLARAYLKKTCFYCMLLKRSLRMNLQCHFFQNTRNNGITNLACPHRSQKLGTKTNSKHIMAQ